MDDTQQMPPGQYEIGEFARFGLAQFARRFPKSEPGFELSIRGDVDQPITITDELHALPRVEQVSDFHCVTTWTYRSVRWSGFRFADVYERIVVPRSRRTKTRLSSFSVVRMGTCGFRKF